MNSCAVTDDYNKSAHWAQAIKHIYTSSNLRTFGWAFKTWTPVPEFDWLTAHSLLAAPTSTLQALSAYQLPVELCRCPCKRPHIMETCFVGTLEPKILKPMQRLENGSFKRLGHVHRMKGSPHAPGLHLMCPTNDGSLPLSFLAHDQVRTLYGPIHAIHLVTGALFV